MSTYFEAQVWVVGKAPDALDLHRKLLRAEIDRPSSSFVHEQLITNRADVAAARYRAGRSQVEPSLAATLAVRDGAIDALDLCVWVTCGTEDEGWGMCFQRGALRFEDSQGADALEHFKRCCIGYGLDLGRCGRLAQLLDLQLPQAGSHETQLASSQDPLSAGGAAR